MGPMDNVRIKRKFSVVGHTPNVVELRHGVWNPVSFTLNDEAQSGRLFSLLSRLDGSVSPGQLASELGVPRAELDALLDHLHELGVLETGSATALDHYLDELVPNLKNARSGPEAPSPVVLLGSPALTRPLAEYLKATPLEAKVELAEADEAWRMLETREGSWPHDALELQKCVGAFEKWRGKLLAVVSEAIAPLRLQLLNRICLELEIPWIHAVVDGPFLFVGPTFVPRRSACYECFERRVAMNLRESASYQRYKRALLEGQVRHGSAPMLPLLGGLLVSHAGLELLNFALTRSTWTLGKVLAIYLPTMEIAFNDVLRLPGCAACGPIPERDETELYFDIRAVAGK